MSRRSDHYRDAIRRRGSEMARRNPPMFSAPRATPKPPAASKDELRAEADRAAAEWRRRYDPGDLEG